MTKITAHRGYSEKYPENTLTAFKKAVEDGADRIELDVHASKDGKLVVHHAYSLGNTDNGEGFIFDRESGYIKSLDAGKWFSNEFIGEKIPFLEEVFETIGNKTEYEIELKGFGEEFIRKALGVVKNFSLLQKVEFTSSSLYTLQKIKQLEHNAIIGMFVPRIQSWMTADLAQKIALNDIVLGNIDVAHCNLEILNDDFIKTLKKEHIKSHAADCNTKEDLLKAFTLSVDQLSTNKLELAIATRE